MVAGDREILTIAVRNLLTNAIKFSQPGQAVSVEMKPREQEIVLTVQDNGQGMTAAQIERILSMNSRSEQGTSGEKGSGLGLFLVRELLQDIRGRLSIESRIGEGSCMSIHVQAL